MSATAVRSLSAWPLLMFAGLLSPASAHAPAACGLVPMTIESPGAGPSKLDFLVLASLADSSGLLAVSAFRSQ